MSSLGMAIGKTFGGTIKASKASRKSALSLIAHADISEEMAEQLMGASTMVGTIKTSMQDSHARDGGPSLLHVLHTTF
jgi:hypothetical protein